MLIRIGYDITYECVQVTPMMLMLSVHHTRIGDLVRPDHLVAEPAVPVRYYRDSFGNWCTRIVAPAGRLRLTTDTLIRDNGQPEPRFPNAQQHPVEHLPDETLVYLLGSRYCETDRLSDFAWKTFGHLSGWGRVQAICDFVHQH
ncbi:MAG: transglutaminase family protein, partial [Rhodospirillales bacterium]|nr:transglutaminase family protein [Rhodospirillales bacterium]